MLIAPMFRANSSVFYPLLTYFGKPRDGLKLKHMISNISILEKHSNFQQNKQHTIVLTTALFDLVLQIYYWFS